MKCQAETGDISLFPKKNCTNFRAFTFSELEQALTHSGFLLDGGKGSHCVYRHPDGRKIVLPRHGNRIKPIYVKLVRKLLSV